MSPRLRYAVRSALLYSVIFFVVRRLFVLLGWTPWEQLYLTSSAAGLLAAAVFIAALLLWPLLNRRKDASDRLDGRTDRRGIQRPDGQAANRTSARHGRKDRR